MSLSSGRFVAATTRTFTAPARRPRRAAGTRPAARARSSMTCALMCRSAISSRKIARPSRGLEASLPVRDGPRERPLPVAEQLAHRQIAVLVLRAVDGHEGPAAARAQQVEGLGEGLLPGAALADDEHGLVVRRPLELAEQAEEAGFLADHLDRPRDMLHQSIDSARARSATSLNAPWMAGGRVWRQPVRDSPSGRWPARAPSARRGLGSQTSGGTEARAGLTRRAEAGETGTRRGPMRADMGWSLRERVLWPRSAGGARSRARNAETTPTETCRARPGDSQESPLRQVDCGRVGPGRHHAPFLLGRVEVCNLVERQLRVAAPSPVAATSPPGSRISPVPSKYASFLASRSDPPRATRCRAARASGSAWRTPP